MTVTAAHDGQPHHADVHLHVEHRVAPVDERIFGGFLEHLGRAVYEGVYDPDSPLSDERGFRTDVLDVLRSLRIPIVRYPGGNFVSNHDWRDAVGPRARRPRRPNVAWRSIESHQFGLDEFIEWCTDLGAEPMMAVNLGTGTPGAAAALLEYCNLPAGTADADQRVANGHAAPYGIKLWCLGNEMDGPWQAGHVPAQTYAERALVASALMKDLDPSIETIACGSSSNTMASYMEWDRIVLEHCWHRIDYISAHRYSRNDHDDTPTFLAEGVEIDRVIDDYRGVLRYVKARYRSTHDVRISFDEWNVWYRATSGDGGFAEAPHLLEEQYNVEDALVCAEYLHAFIRHADVVGAACLAQLVNVIAPILTRADGLLIQTIYWPFKLIRDAMSGDALRVVVNAPEMTTRHGDVPVLDVAATHAADGRTAGLSIVNRDASTAVEVSIDVVGAGFEVASAHTITGHPKAVNGWDTPDAIRPIDVDVRTDDDGRLHVTLAAPRTR